MKKALWAAWLILLLASSGWLGARLLASEDRSIFLPGQTSHGHHQIELACGTCHTSPFGGTEVLHDACIQCHGDELKTANDSHPISKFTDPRNADRLGQIDARLCVSCHREHVEDQTRAMGVTLPDDFCVACHLDIAEDRPSHAGMSFDTCASAGCHNFHDNQALYEDFLLKHAIADTSEKIAGHVYRHVIDSGEKSLAADQADHAAPAPEIVSDWAMSGHAKAGVNCSDCHQRNGTDWIEKPDRAICADCHRAQHDTFVSGKHGMRLDSRLSIDGVKPMHLSPMKPALGRLTFTTENMNKPLDCVTCHSAHRFDVGHAAVESCLGCHDDEHSRNYTQSPHLAQWQKEIAGTAAPGTGVTCATCHMPAEASSDPQRPHAKFRTHNQNATLRPNEKMIRPVCLHCHDLAFSIDALADAELVRNNFSGKPSRHVSSIDMAVDRETTQSGSKPKPNVSNHQE